MLKDVGTEYNQDERHNHREEKNIEDKGSVWKPETKMEKRGAKEILQFIKLPA